MNLKKPLMVLPILLLGLSFFGACASDDESSEDNASSTAPDGSGEPGYSTKVTTCEVDKTATMVKVEAEIDNETEQTQSYILNIGVSDAKGQHFTEITAVARDVAAGETGTTHGLARGSINGSAITCEIYSVMVG